MYASEKYVRQEVRELRSQINESASDIGADIKYLFSLIEGIQEQLNQIKERLDNES
jgi:methyl-accepting chemotaxis protein